MRLVVEAEHHIHLEQRFGHSRRTEAEKVVGLVAILVGVAASDVVVVEVPAALAAEEEQARGLLDLHDQP
jgi:predicted benzoate:H+ symporter BenE